MSEYWYVKSAGRLLVDMHIPDWDKKFFRNFSAEQYAERMAEADVDTVEIYAGSCLGLCNWPTDIGYRHANSGDADLLGATVDACRRRGLQVVLYLNVWSRKAYDEHPEWRMIMPDGLGSVEHDHGRFGICCPNSGFQDYFLALLDELNGRYECVGLWIDMIGWFSRICYCPGCQQRFRRETGYAELPRRIDWDDPAWIAFQRCREKWLAEFAANIRETIKRRTPERSVALQSSSLLGGWGSAVTPEFLHQSDYLAADLYGDQYEQSFVCKLFHAFSRTKPIEFMVPRCENLNHHTTNRSQVNLEMRSYASLANQACFSLIDAIDPAGTLDVDFYRTAGELNRQLRRYAGSISAHSEAIADAAIYYSFESMVDFAHTPQDTADSKWDSSDYLRMINLTRALQQKHLTVAFTGKPHLAELSRYPVVILSEASHLDEEECAALEQYVYHGGKLYASGLTSLYDPVEGRRDNFRLSTLFGVQYTGDTVPPVSYLTPRTDKSTPVISERPRPEIAVNPATELTVLGTLTLPYSTPEELYRFGSAISNPPEIDTVRPALTKRQYGRGEVIYSSGAIESEPYDFHREFFGSLIESFVGTQRLITTDAPQAVEITLFDQPEAHRWIVALLHFTTELPPPPLGAIQMSIQLPAGKASVTRVTEAPEGTPLPFHQQAGRVTFTLPGVHKFTLINLEF